MRLAGCSPARSPLSYKGDVVSMNLQILLGRERGRVVAVQAGTYIFGRGADSNVVLDSDIVSRTHAQITVGATDLRVTDLGSSNGTYINGARVLGEGIVN